MIEQEFVEINQINGFLTFIWSVSILSAYLLKYGFIKQVIKVIQKSILIIVLHITCAKTILSDRLISFNIKRDSRFILQ